MDKKYGTFYKYGTHESGERRHGHVIRVREGENEGSSRKTGFNTSVLKFLGRCSVNFTPDAIFHANRGVNLPDRIF